MHKSIILTAAMVLFSGAASAADVGYDGFYLGMPAQDALARVKAMHSEWQKQEVQDLTLPDGSKFVLDAQFDSDKPSGNKNNDIKLVFSAYGSGNRLYGLEWEHMFPDTGKDSPTIDDTVKAFSVKFGKPHAEMGGGTDPTRVLFWFVGGNVKEVWRSFEGELGCAKMPASYLDLKPACAATVALTIFDDGDDSDPVDHALGWNLTMIDHLAERKYGDADHKHGLTATAHVDDGTDEEIGD